MQHILTTVEEAYLAGIRNKTTNSTNNTVADVLTHLQETYRQLITQELLESKDIVKKTTYHTWEPIATVFSFIKELLVFSNITGIFYMQHQAVNIAYVIINRTVKFVLENREWNQMLNLQKTWVIFKQFFWSVNQKLQETTEITV